MLLDTFWCGTPNFLCTHQWYAGDTSGYSYKLAGVCQCMKSWTWYVVFSVLHWRVESKRAFMNFTVAFLSKSFHLLHYKLWSSKKCNLFFLLLKCFLGKISYSQIVYNNGHLLDPFSSVNIFMKSRFWFGSQMQVINFQHRYFTVNVVVTQMARVILPIKCPTYPNRLLSFRRRSSPVVVPCSVHTLLLWFLSLPSRHKQIPCAPFYNNFSYPGPLKQICLHTPYPMFPEPLRYTKSILRMPKHCLFVITTFLTCPFVWGASLAIVTYHIQMWQHT